MTRNLQIMTEVSHSDAFDTLECQQDTNNAQLMLVIIYTNLEHLQQPNTEVMLHYKFFFDKQ